MNNFSIQFSEYNTIWCIGDRTFISSNFYNILLPWSRNPSLVLALYSLDRDNNYLDEDQIVKYLNAHPLLDKGKYGTEFTIELDKMISMEEAIRLYPQAKAQLDSYKSWEDEHCKVPDIPEDQIDF